MKVLVKTFFMLTLWFLISFTMGSRTNAFASTKHESEASFFEFGISGPEELCLYYGSIIGEFFGGGRVTDVFRWQIISQNGQVIVDREGGFQTFSHTFSEVGEYEIRLNVRRGVEEVFSDSKNILINPGADIVLKSSYLLCDNGSTTMQVLDPSTPNLSDYRIEWKDSSGQVVNTGNTFTSNRPDRYTVSFFTINQNGEQVCPFSLNTHVNRPRDFNISISASEVCSGGSQVTLNASNNAFGNWFYIKSGSTEKVLLGEGRRLDFVVNRDLDGTGEYEFIFEPDNSDNEYCKLEDRISFKVNPTPDVRIFFEQSAENCDVREGVLVIEALTDLDRIFLRKNDEIIERFFDIKEGEVIRLTGMDAAIYRASVTLNSCSRGRSVLLPMEDPPQDLLFNIEEIQDESCNDTGKVDGIVKIRLNQPNFTGRYRVLFTSGIVFSTGELEGVDEFEFSAPAGTYHLELSNGEDCAFPNEQRINISSKGEVNFSVPNRLTICEFFDFTPGTNVDLVFTLTYPDNSTVTKPSGEAFRLDQAGEYILLGRDVNTEDGFCPRERTFLVNLTNPINYEPELISEDCFGNKQYFANLFGADPSRYNIRWINEQNEVVGTEEFLFPISSGEFKLDVQPRNSEVCPTPPKSFFIERSVTAVDVNLLAGPLCPGAEASIELATDFEEVTQIFWLYIDPDGDIQVLDEFEGMESIVISEEGSYEAVVYNRLNCEIGRNFIQIAYSEDRAYFEVPEEMIICEFYEFTPETELDLMYRVIFPDGDEKIYQKDEIMIFDQDGEHLIIAESADTEVFLCPISKTVSVSRKDALLFEPVLYEQTCEGVLTYKAELFGISTSEADIFWYGPNGELLEEGEFFLPEEDGIFELEVRPAGSLVCPEPSRRSFEVIMPITELDGGLLVAPYCPDAPFTTITLEADLSQVVKINWYFTDLNGNKILLEHFSNDTEINVVNEGLYEVETFNSLNCLLGADEVLVLRSIDEVRPEVEDEYIICAQFGLFENIDPGSFSEYRWFLNGSLIAEGRNFEPQEAGFYELIVTSDEGCDYATSFTVKEECQLQIKHTTGMRPNNANYPFVVYANFLIDELEVWIYNKWGQLVHHCQSHNLMEGTPACTWTGILDDQKIQPGAYAVKIRYKNNFENINRTEFSSLIVLD